MKIQKNDKVIVIAGKDKGKTGVVLKALPQKNKVVIEGVNVQKKHIKAGATEGGAGIIERAAPIDVSNVMIIDPESKKPSRIGKKLVGGKYVRIAKKSGAEI